MNTPVAPDPTLIGIFEAEVTERVATMHDHLLQIEAGVADRGQRLEDLLRLAHDLKGSARVVGYEVVARLAHALEDRLMSWRRRDRVDAVEIELALRAADSMLDISVGPQDARLAELAETQIGKLLGGAPVAPPPAAASAPVRPFASSIPACLPPDGTDGMSRRSVEAVAPPAPEAGAASRNPASAVSCLPPFVARDGALQRGDTLRIARAHIDAVSEDVATTLFDSRRVDARLEELSRALTALGSVRLPRPGSGPREIARSCGDLRSALRRLRTCSNELRDTLRQSHRNVRTLDDHARALCLVPAMPLVVHLERVARDAAGALGRRVEMSVEGRDLYVDMLVLEALKAPLTHAVRNAVDHGLEAPAAREAVGKRPAGTLRLELREERDQLLVSIGDDGRGIDREAVRARLGAGARGLDDRQLFTSLLRSGLSTREQVTQMSGRGLGLGTLAVVADQLRGDVDIESRAGHGTTITLRLPLRLSLLEGLLVDAGDSRFVLPVSGLSGVGGDAPRATRLAALLGLGAAGQPLQSVQIKGRDRDVTFAVDKVHERVEVVRRSVGAHLGRVAFVDGATILPGGEPAFILDTREIAAASGGTAASARTRSGGGPSRGRILIVDDSPTLRAKLHHDLAAAGFDVTQAEDGLLALERVAEHGFDVIVSDVQMPRLDGFALLARCGAQTPVVLITAWPDELAELRARELGAVAYIPKDDLLTEHIVLTLRKLLDRTPEGTP